MARRKKDNRPVWTLDCETDPFKHGRTPRPFIWGLYTGAGYHTFDTVEEVVEAIKDNDVIVYAHNGGKFDFHYLLNNINLCEKITVINGRLVVAHIGAAEIRDSWNLMPFPLAEYKKDDFDYRKMEADVRHKHMPEIRHYLRNDCVFLYELIDTFERDYGRHLTMAGACMKQWEAISSNAPPKTDKDFFQKFNPYYYGGRVQCFEKGRIEGPCNVYDIRSAYPRAMLENHPYSPEYITTKNPTEFRPTSMVTVECVSYGALPMRTETGGIIFPDDGELRVYTVVGHELLAGIETNTVARVRLIESIDFITETNFAPYINHFYDTRRVAREAGEDAKALFCKYFMNSLYGKFAANPENYGNFMCVPFQEMEDYCDGTYDFDGMIGPHALMKAPLDPWQERYYHVACAASITSWVRAYLWRAIQKAERPLYCDTDSLICAHADLEIGSELGQWQHEGTADTVWIAGKKMYLCDGLFDKHGKPKQATKGVKLTPQQIRAVAMGGKEIYLPEAPTFSLIREPRFTPRTVKMTA